MAKIILDYFKKNGGIVRFSSLLKAGFHPDSLKALEKAGKVQKVARGVRYKGDHVFLLSPDSRVLDGKVD